ncbi:hypothetical protein Shyhy02_07840 [Streptomyces hygroscopicus subsp. hygroscopicus]|nr:hypothetical protein Shyhy02_07840 [Streptomyces hygroscopicus subsp. hygroscopicus]
MTCPRRGTLAPGDVSPPENARTRRRVRARAVGAAAVLGQEGVPLVIPWDRAALFFVASAAIGVLASRWPGRRAARVPMLTAITADTG